MLTKYKIIFIIAFLLLMLSVSLSFMNYFVSLHNAQKNLNDTSLPLSTDNISSEIQTHIIEPNIIASMMAQDTFLKDWLEEGEEDEKKIKRFLESIKNKYQMYTVFLASEKTQHYYSAKGFVEKMDKKKSINAWYYTFKDTPLAHEINIDYNTHIDDSLIMFVNHKIFDADYHLLGVTGVGMRVAYINEMLKRFRVNYKFQVYFVDKEAQIVLKESGLDAKEHVSQNIKTLIASDKRTFRYTVNDETFLLHLKFMPELNLYLVVQAKVSDFTFNALKTLCINLFASFFVTLLIIYIIMRMIKKHTKKLEDIANFDALTQLETRRSFSNKLAMHLLQRKRKKFDVCILFFDIDDFKKINDTLGHDVGDKVLMRVAQIIKNNIRVTDFTGRWGGEEFIISLVDSSLEDSKKIAEKIRKNIEEDKALYKLLSYNLTASFGLTYAKVDEPIGTMLKRVDDALYKAKNTGKNKVVLA